MGVSKLTDKQRKKIVSDYIQTQNYRETGRINGVSETTCRRILKEENANEVSQRIAKKHEENTQSTLEYMQSQSETKNRIINKLLKAIETKAENVDMFTNIKDLATAYGVLIDKELKLLEIQKSQKELNNGLDKVQQLLEELQKEANK